MSEDEANAAAFAAGSLAAAICNADEVRRPVDEDARTRAFMKRHGRRASSAAMGERPKASELPRLMAPIQGHQNGNEASSVLPRGRNFH